MTQQYAFQAEINQLLSLIINAFYQEKEVFLRELVSNASDALDKMRIKTLSRRADDEPPMVPAAPLASSLRIRIVPKKTDKVLIIEDNGVGMSADDMVTNLGTIAHSGTKAFMEALAAGAKSSGDSAAGNLIGQFGVGFYSAFLVASQVDVFSRTADSADTYCWSSNASGTFTVGKADDGDDLAHPGTRVVLHLKDGCEEFADEYRIRQVIKRHSDFCAYPILLTVTRTKEEEIAAKEDEEKEEQEQQEQQEQSRDDNNDGQVEAAPFDTDAGDKKHSKKTITREVEEEEELNKVRPVWQRKPEEVTVEEHDAFYKSLCGDWEAPVAYKHFEVDGQLQFKAVIYAPKRPPFDMFQPSKKKNGIRLHVRRVFVTDSLDDLVPDWLSFIKGVVDSDDMPLNVSRETLQQNRIVKVIGKNIVKRSLDMMTELADASDRQSAWLDFYEGYSKNIKMGVHSDHQNRERLLNLLRFHSTKTVHGERETMVSLKAYCGRMKKGQKDVYFMTSESLDAAGASPLHERLRKLGIEVLLMTDPIDEYVMQAIHEYDGHRFINIAKDGLELPSELLYGEDEVADAEELEEKRNRRYKAAEGLCGALKSALGELVTKVQPSTRLDESPCVLITEMYGWTANMERIMKAQALGDAASSPSGLGAAMSRKILEINLDNPIVTRMAERVERGEQAEKSFKDAVQLMYDTALISCGFVMGNPSKYASRIFRLIALGLGSHEDEEDASVGTITEPADMPAPAVDTSMEEVD